MQRMLPVVDYCQRLNCHLQATFGVAAVVVHSFITQQSSRNHVTTLVRRSVGRSPSGASRNAVLAGNGWYVPAQSLVSVRPVWRLAAPRPPALKCTSPSPRSLSFPPDRWPSNTVDACCRKVQNHTRYVQQHRSTHRMTSSMKANIMSVTKLPFYDKIHHSLYPICYTPLGAWGVGSKHKVGGTNSGAKLRKNFFCTPLFIWTHFGD